MRTTTVKSHTRRLPEKKPDPLQAEIDRRRAAMQKRRHVVSTWRTAWERLKADIRGVL